MKFPSLQDGAKFRPKMRYGFVLLWQPAYRKKLRRCPANTVIGSWPTRRGSCWLDFAKGFR